MKLMYDPSNLLPNIDAMERKVLEMECMDFIFKSLPQQQLRLLTPSARHQVSNTTTKPDKHIQYQQH